MYSLIDKSFCFLVFLSVVLNLNFSNAATGPNHGKVVVCYVGTWAVYRPGKGSFDIEHLDPSLCTHVVYAFVGLNTTHDSIRSLDPWQDLPDNYGKNGFARAVSLKDRYPHLKVTVAIGGWNEGSTNYSNLVAEPGRRKRFVVNALEFVRKHNFDGLDLDWEFPAKRGGIPQDKENFLSLVKELRSVFNTHNLLLTAAFGAGKETIDVAYDVAELSKYLDYVHLMCYDYHGAWDMKTGANAPLRSTDALNVEFSIKYMIQLGMEPSKLIMGIPLYGRTFYSSNTAPTSDQGIIKLGEPTKMAGFQGPFTRENGFMGYNEICAELQNETLGWKKYWDDITVTPYAVNEDKVIVYDDEKSITEKVKFAIFKKLGGTMVWSIDTDDFLGECSLGKISANSNQRFNDNFPLMRTINEAIIQALEDAENEIPDESNKKKNQDGNNAVIKIPSYIFVVLMAVALLY